MVCSPLIPAPPPSSTRFMSLKRDIYTIWMKSLVLNGNGCTIYDSDGEVVYRVDNYDHKHSSEVYLMDRAGKTHCKILRKKFRMFGTWEGYRCDDVMAKEGEPWFKVQRGSSWMPNSAWSSRTMVIVGCGTNSPSCYKIDGTNRKSDYTITDATKGLAAAVKQKHTVTGIALGDDVLTLVVEPNVDHLLIMGLVVVCGLINCHM